MTIELHVHHVQQRVGVLTHDPWRFQYSDDWIASGGWPLSASLPVRVLAYADEARDWFANLLPEGAAREQVARRFRIHAEDDFGLLVALGGECAGAVTLDLHDAPPGAADGSRYRLVDADDLSAWLFSGDPSRVYGDETRLSLAGAQHKIAVRLGPDDGIYIPVGHGASTHILKAASQAHASLVHNELLCLLLARAVGLDAVEAGPLVVGDQLGLLVTRYDRSFAASSTAESSDRIGEIVLPPVTRRHQEDLAQALGCSRHRKYEADGGPSLADVAGLLRRDGLDPATDLSRLIRWLAFCTITGNRDNHAKNLSRLLDPASRRWQLAPFYDLVNTTSYTDLSTELAFHIGGERRLAAVRRSTWEAQATALGVAPRLVLREVEDMTTKIEESLPRCLEATVAQLGDANKFVQFVRAIKKGVRAVRSTLGHGR